jgi:hypothetical protein
MWLKLCSKENSYIKMLIFKKVLKSRAGDVARGLVFA